MGEHPESGLWPASRAALLRAQVRLARAAPEPWRPGGGDLTVGGCFVAFPRGLSGPGATGDRGWAAAVLARGGRPVATAIVAGEAGAPYGPGMLFLRSGAPLAAAVRALPRRPDVLLVNATGRDHPRRAGLALHLGAALDMPTVGVTHRPLIARGSWPDDEAGRASPLRIDDDVVGYWLRTRAGTRPLAVHAAWRTDPETALAVVRAATGGARTPVPLRLARQAARRARDEAGD